ncbi:MAG: hypothetical protein KAI17_02480, partial [Thiotrichaceae bacterium]|nr:hypothetical protein [Thiotrichaceae bacterium]
YSKKFKDFEDVFQNAGVMNSAVELAERIKKNGETSPLDFLITLSDALSKENIGTVYIDKIEWRATNINIKTKKSKKANFTEGAPVKHNAIVTGRIIESEDNYRASVDQIKTIINHLKSNPRVEDINALVMPVDLRSESKFSTEYGVDIEQRLGSGESTGIFSLEIIMKGPNHV